MATLSATEARNNFSNLLKEAEREVILITQHNRPAAAVLSWALYESMLETLEILSDPDMMKSIQRGEADSLEGNLEEWESIKRSLDS